MNTDYCQGCKQAYFMCHCGWSGADELEEKREAYWACHPVDYDLSCSAEEMDDDKAAVIRKQIEGRFREWLGE